MIDALYSYEETLAKNDEHGKQTLEEHSMDCSTLFDHIRPFKENLASSLCKRLQISKDELWRHVFLSVVLHDIGKATEVFQNYVRGATKEKVSHAFVSFFFADEVLRQNFSSGILLLPDPLAVACHHSELHTEKFSGRYELDEDPCVLEPVVRQFLNVFVRRVYEERFRDSLKLTATIPKTYSQIYDRYKLYQTRISREGRLTAEYFRLKYAFTKSVIHYCDWYASGRSEYIPYKPLDLHAKTLRYLVSKTHLKQPLSDLQQALSSIVGNTLVTAPTGTGKTEASLLWASKNFESRKLLYLLPTMTTCNRIRARLKDISGDEVGLAHGSSDFVLWREENDTSWDFRKSLFSRAFIYGSTVATLDQFLLASLNWGKWYLKLMNSSNSCIVIDEVHAYDPFTVALTLEAVEKAVGLGARVLFMTATMPPQLRTKLKEYLSISDLNILIDKSHDDVGRVLLEFTNHGISECVNDVIQDAKAGKKVLVICNTVAKAKELYSSIIKRHELNQDEIMLLHSQFIARDRANKETVLEDLPKKGFVCIATQVVEVSLDIDFNSMHTEACPIEALVQRLGRINRKGSRPPEKAIVYSPSDSSANVYDPLVTESSMNILREEIKSDGLLKNSIIEPAIEKLCDEQDYLDQLDREIAQASTDIDNLLNSLKCFQLTISEMRAKGLTTRRQRYLTIEIIPKEFSQKVLNKEERFARAEYSVKVPFYKVYRLLDEEDGLTFADVRYDSDLGVIYPTGQIDDNII